MLPVDFRFRSAVSDEKSKISQPIRSRGGNLVFRNVPKNTNLVEDVKAGPFRLKQLTNTQVSTLTLKTGGPPGPPEANSTRPNSN